MSEKNDELMAFLSAEMMAKELWSMIQEDIEAGVYPVLRDLEDAFKVGVISALSANYAMRKIEERIVPLN